MLCIFVHREWFYGLQTLLALNFNHDFCVCVYIYIYIYIYIHLYLKYAHFDASYASYNTTSLHKRILLISIYPYLRNMFFVFFVVVGWMVVWVLWHINLCWLFNAKSIFMKIILFQTIQFGMSTEFNCQKRFYFKLFSLVKQF